MDIRIAHVAERAAGAEPRIVDQAVNRSEICTQRFHQRADLSDVGQVAGPELDGAAAAIRGRPARGGEFFAARASR